ncbi:uncharacterized protein LOC122061826 [Macadamia integrifolia]|uniref:uncharacterized protein LOC122061826 n=1 Tax=Macadamia integrifolia TaxID=60698 RepID=UPI001C531410|nr:uncharacterized protein LOC122061826 [Macadamia integrifolia]
MKGSDGYSTNSNPKLIEDEQKRCRAVEDRIRSLPLSKITNSCKRTLLRLVNSELEFLSRLSSNSPNFAGPICVNIGYLESVVHILQQTFITGVSRVCKPIPLTSGNGEKKCFPSKGVHVDIVCTIDSNPVWFVVSDRNPKYISWSGSHKNKGLRMRIEQVVEAAHSSLTLKPSSIILFFANGLDKVLSLKVGDEFGASEFGKEFFIFDSDITEELEGDWVKLHARSFRGASIFQIKIDAFMDTVSSSEPGLKDPLRGTATLELPKYRSNLVPGDAFCSLISRIKLISLDTDSATPEALLGEELVNFDTTALVALVSGISNDDTDKLLATPESELTKRFKSNTEFVIAQVKSEIQTPILTELEAVISGKICMICKTVHLEFKELLSMCGGSNEKWRADHLLKCLLVVPDHPSARMMGLPTTRKIALKNKILFGTGDYFHAPTLTANMGFVRAISQTGMPLSTVEHRPRALTGD